MHVQYILCGNAHHNLRAFYVFLVAMTILPFLQNMLLNIVTGHCIILYVYVDIIFLQISSDRTIYFSELEF